MSIRLRLTLWYTTLLSIVLALFALLVYTVVADQLANQLEYALHLRALTRPGRRTLPMSSAISHLGEPWPLRMINSVAEEDLYTQVVTPGGDVLSASRESAAALANLVDVPSNCVGRPGCARHPGASRSARGALQRALSAGESGARSAPGGRAAATVGGQPRSAPACAGANSRGRQRAGRRDWRLPGHPGHAPCRSYDAVGAGDGIRSGLLAAASPARGRTSWAGSRPLSTIC